MRRACFLSFLLFLVLGRADVSLAQDQPNFYAVVIGVSQFAHLPKEDWLEFANADAKAFVSLISSPRGRSFPAENVFILTDQDASHDAIKKRLGYLLPKIVKKPSDTVYIFVATHGMVEKDAAQDTYFLGYDSDREDLYDSALSLKDLQDIIQNRLKSAGRVFLFADACRSGKLGKLQGMFSQQLQDAGKQRGGLLASRANEFSREGKQFGGGHGVFSYFLLKGLMGEADEDKDKVVTADEMINYLRDKVTGATDRQQHIQEFGDFVGETPLAYVDKPGPTDLNLAALPHVAGTEIASAQVVRSESVETRIALERAVRDGRLLGPAGNNAWELYQRYARLPGSESDKEVVKDDLVIALATEGEKVLWAYRRGDQVIRLDAAKYAEGAQLFDRASQIEPDDTALQAKAKFLAGRLQVENRRFPEGISLLREAIQLDPGAAYPYNAMGIAYMEQQRWNDAIQNFKEASGRAEKWVYPHYNLARVYTGQQRYREAEQEFKKGIEIGSDLGLKYAYLHYNLGILYLFQGRVPEAEEQFRNAVAMKPDDAMSYHNLGLVLQRKGDSGQAELSFRKAAELDAKLVEPRMKLAEMYRDQHRNDLQERMLQEAAAADPRNPAPAETLGRLLLERKKLEEAERVFMQMLTGGADATASLSGLGDVHSAQGRWKDATEDYRQAMARTTDRKLLRDLEKKLRAAEKKQ